MSLIQEKFRTAHIQMIKEIKENFKETAARTGINRMSQEVLRALQNVPRHLFASKENEEYAYINSALSIGEGQTISQPFIVALMTELLQVKPTDKVLEIGTGSGYQAAILGQLAREVYTIEVFTKLSNQAAAIFSELGYKNIHTLIANGSKGWPEHAPYDKVIITAALSEIPQALLDQLSPGGLIVAPITYSVDNQVLTVIEKDKNSKIRTQRILDVRFVPFL